MPYRNQTNKRKRKMNVINKIIVMKLLQINNIISFILVTLAVEPEEYCLAVKCYSCLADQKMVQVRCLMNKSV